MPPILQKKRLNEEPLLKLLWSKAFNALQNADRITFVGYSLPITDIAATALFTEGLHSKLPKQVNVVNLESDMTHQNALKDRYLAIVPGLTHLQFDFIGALHWMNALGEGQSTN